MLSHQHVARGPALLPAGRITAPSIPGDEARSAPGEPETTGFTRQTVLVLELASHEMKGCGSAERALSDRLARLASNSLSALNALRAHARHMIEIADAMNPLAAYSATRLPAPVRRVIEPFTLKAAQHRSHAMTTEKKTVPVEPSTKPTEAAKHSDKRAPSATKHEASPAHKAKPTGGAGQK
jgi:hypothetical protein